MSDGGSKPDGQPDGDVNGADGEEEVVSPRALAKAERKEEREAEREKLKADKAAKKLEKKQQKESGEYKGIFARMALFFRQVVAELRKVIWPTRRELVSYTWIVLVFVLIMGAYIGVLDFVFTRGVLFVFGRS